MPTGIIIGLGSGLVSALLFYSAARGGPLLRPFLLFLIPLPSLVAGLGWGWLAAARRLLPGAVVVGSDCRRNGRCRLSAGARRSGRAGRLSRLSQPPRPGRPGSARMVSGRSADGWHGALRRRPAVMLLPLIGGSYETLRPLMSEVLQQFAKRWLPPGTSLSEQALAEQTSGHCSCCRPALPCQWLVVCALNLYLAGRIVCASGLWGATGRTCRASAIRPALAVLLGLALLAAAAGGADRRCRRQLHRRLAGGLSARRLALTHFIARRRAPWLIWLVYLGLFFLWPFFMPLVVLAGLLESDLHS